MPGNFFRSTFVFLLVVYLSSFAITSPLPLLAQDDPSPTSFRPTCDLCGWCGRFITPPAPSPYNWNECFECLYEKGDPNDLEKPNRYFTVVGCIDTNEGAFTNRILSVIFGISGGVAFLSVISGSITLLTSSGSPDKIQKGKEIITSSIIGLLLIIFSVFLLRAIGFDILRIPGFG